MIRLTTAFIAVGLSVVGAVEAQAYPMIASFEGIIYGTTSTFQASFRYDTRNLGPQDSDGYRNAVSGTQTATYTDSTGLALTFSPATSFYLGNYQATGFDSDGSQVTNNVVEYSLRTGSGLINFTFGGFNDGGVVTYDADGLDSKTLTPTKFILTKGTVESMTPGVSPVPLPKSVLLFGGALVALGCFGRFRRASASKIA